ARGLLNICVPASLIEASGTNLVIGHQTVKRERTALEERWLMESLGRVPVGVSADIETKLKTRELISLQEGQILSLGIPADANVNIRVGNIVKYRGRLAATNGRGGVLVTRRCVGNQTGDGA